MERSISATVLEATGKTVPLVTIGVPAHERPELLARTLKSLIEQTYTNLEIIVSDNFSLTPGVQEVLDRWSRLDSRIRIFRQSTNIGVIQNFNFVLEQAHADWFMWVADDDYLAPWYVEKCMNVMLSDSRVFLCATETQFISSGGTSMAGVTQGKAFRQLTGLNRLSRMKYLLKNNFDCLIYGLFKKEALMRHGRMLWGSTAIVTNNEIPPLLLAAKLGEIIVLPDFGAFKTVTASVHSHSRWLAHGGRLPKSSRITSLRSFIATWNYHVGVMRGVDVALKQLELTTTERFQLSFISKKLILTHFVWLILKFKPESNRML